jgi:hypothetical protein
MNEIYISVESKTAVLIFFTKSDSIGANKIAKPTEQLPDYILTR